MYYQYICDNGEEKSVSLIWVQFDLLAIPDLLRWFGGSEFW